MAMLHDEVSRREWMLASSLGLLALWPEILAAQEHARHAAATPGTAFTYFDPATAAEIEAIAAQIIPTDETPGARESGASNLIKPACTSSRLSAPPCSPARKASRTQARPAVSAGEVYRRHALL